MEEGETVFGGDAWTRWWRPLEALGGPWRPGTSRASRAPGLPVARHVCHARSRDGFFGSTRVTRVTAVTRLRVTRVTRVTARIWIERIFLATAPAQKRSPLLYFHASSLREAESNFGAHGHCRRDHCRASTQSGRNPKNLNILGAREPPEHVRLPTVRTGPCAKLRRPGGRAPGAKHDPPAAGSGAVGWKAQLLASPVLWGDGGLRPLTPRRPGMLNTVLLLQAVYGLLG